ncbi:hypothetical protein A3B57_00120, partial [Microgenomates group bacterium RIFCSPLOWO2_01_FULL_47_10]
MSIKKWLALFSLLWFICPTIISAQAPEDWVIDSFDSAITLTKSGKATVAETIVADFGMLSKHGIFRTIPTTYRTNYNTNLDIRLSIESVTNALGSPIKYETTRKNGEVEIKIGHPDVTVSGKQTYVIVYQVDNALTHPTQNNEWYWNVTGNHWPVPIALVTAKVLFPPNSIKNTVCFVGTVGETGQNCTKQNAGETAIFSAGKLSLGEGLTIAVALDPTIGAMPSKQQLWWWKLVDNWVVAIPILTFLLMLRLYFLEGRDKKYRHMFNETEVVSVPLFEKLNSMMTFDLPRHISPGEVGVLVDERVEMKDITAIAIDMASKGFFTIKELNKKKLFADEVDFELTLNNKSESTLKPYQLKVMDMLFSASRKSPVKLSKLPDKAYSELDAAITALYDHATSSGLFANSPQKIRSFYKGLGVVLIFMSFVQGIFLSNWFDPIFSGLCVFVSGLIVLLFSPFMPARTAKGRKLLAEVVGLKEWIRIGAWREKIHEKNLFLEEVLPYTIVFGMTAKFIKAFSQSDLKKMDWYTSADPAHFAFPTSFNSFENHLNGGVAETRPKTSSTSYGGYSRTGASS